MGKQRCTGVDVPGLLFRSAFAGTPTAVPQRPTAGKVGVLDILLAARSAVTSTLSAAAAEEGGSAVGVVVAEILLPSRCASTPTPTDNFLLVAEAMQIAAVDVPEPLL